METADISNSWFIARWFNVSMSCFMDKIVAGRWKSSGGHGMEHECIIGVGLWPIRTILFPMHQQAVQRP